MTITDLVTSFLSVLFLARGAYRGFMNSLLGPFSIIVAAIASIVYYQITKDMLISLFIGLAGPLILTFLLRFLLKSWISTGDAPLGTLSRVGGAILTLTWGWVFIFFTVILLVMLPMWGETLTAVHNDVAASVSYKIIKPGEEIFFAASKKNAVTHVTSNADARSLANDPRFQRILQDPEIQEEINAHDFAKLISNPKMMELTRQIMNDPATMKKVMAIYSSQPQSQK